MKGRMLSLLLCACVHYQQFICIYTDSNRFDCHNIMPFLKYYLSVLFIRRLGLYYQFWPWQMLTKPYHSSKPGVFHSL